MREQRDWAEIARAGLIPTLAALVVATVQMIERAQVDWSADCSTPGQCDIDPINAFPGLMSGWLLAIFVFAVLHAALRKKFDNGPVSGRERGIRVAAYVLISLLPFFGWYLLYAGIGAGYAAALTIIALPISPFIGVLGAGWAGGLILALAAGPPLRTTQWREWRRVLLRYANATALAALILTGAHLVADPQFSTLTNDSVGVRTALLLLATGLSCALIWIASLTRSRWIRSVTATPELRRALKISLAAIVPLAIAAQFAVSNSATVFPRTAQWIEPVVPFIRGYRPPGSTPVTLGGLEFVGPRSIILERSRLERAREVYEKRDVGTDKEANYSWTTFDPYPEWRIAPPADGQDFVVLTDDGSSNMVGFYCKPEEAGRELCLRDRAFHKEFSEHEVMRTVAFEAEDGYVFAAGVNEAMLAVRYDAGSQGEASKSADWKPLYCRLNLLNVTTAKFSAHQVVPCGGDWLAQAKALRAYIERIFTPTTSAAPTQRQNKTN